MADDRAPAEMSLRNLDNSTRKVMVELDADNSGKISASEIKNFVTNKNKQVQRMVLIGAALFLLLVGSIAVIGGVTYYTVQVSKETKALGTDLVSATTGETLHVMSTEALTPVSEVHAGYGDEFFNSLSAVTLSPQGTASMTLHVVGFLRDESNNVRLLTPSATVPCLFFNASGGVSGCDPATTTFLIGAGVLVDPAVQGRRLAESDNPPNGAVAGSYSNRYKCWNCQRVRRREGKEGGGKEEERKARLPPPPPGPASARARACTSTHTTHATRSHAPGDPLRAPPPRPQGYYRNPSNCKECKQCPKGT